MQDQKLDKRLDENRLAKQGCRLKKQTRDSTKMDSRREDVGSKNRQENKIKQTRKAGMQA